MDVQVRAKIWLQIDQEAAFCQGKARLLSAIRERGSIRQAAIELGMSYRRAWTYLRELEAAIGEPVVETRIGGADGGGAVLSDRGAALLDRYTSAMRTVSDALKKQHVATV